MRMIQVTLAGVIACIFLTPLQGTETDHWETVVSKGSVCRYIVPVAAMDDNWKAISFDDSSWASGPGGVGYGDGDDETTIQQTLSVYCRYTFELPDPSIVHELLLDVDFDDGFVAYLNGREIGRYHMGDPGTATAWDQPAAGFHEASLYQGGIPHRVYLPDDLVGSLVAGSNVLAIEVHNENIHSSDLSSNIYLHAGIRNGNRYFSDPPAWFSPPVRTDSTRLPLMVISTGGRSIPDEPRITAHMGLIHNGPGSLNSPEDSCNVYDGQISIEMRGESTLALYPKKSYSIETQTATGENNNVSLLGLPAENDYVLYAPYGDKSLIRNVLSYSLYGKMGHYSPRTRFVELTLNGDYQGLYVLTEKIKRDKNRVDMARLRPEDLSGKELSGGYLLRVDKLTKMSWPEYWESPVQSPVGGYSPVTYQYFDPKYEELMPAQREYIRNYLNEFEQHLASIYFKDPGTGYRKYLDIPSMVDLMILNEVTKDVDGYRLSHYFYKQKVTNGGKLVNGPPWDYNLTFGNSDYTEHMHQPFDWAYKMTNAIYWWARVMQDPWFRNRLYCRWEELYKTVLNPDQVSGMIDSLVNELGDAIPRNFQRWPVLGVYVWPNYFVGNRYQDEQEHLRSWTRNRLSWMQTQWGGLCEPFPEVPEEPITDRDLKVYPNPSDFSSLTVRFAGTSASTIRIRILDLNGKALADFRQSESAGEFTYRLPDLSGLPAGAYTLEVTAGSTIRELVKIIKVTPSYGHSR